MPQVHVQVREGADGAAGPQEAARLHQRTGDQTSSKSQSRDFLNIFAKKGQKCFLQSSWWTDFVKVSVEISSIFARQWQKCRWTNFAKCVAKIFFGATLTSTEATLYAKKQVALHRNCCRVCDHLFCIHKWSKSLNFILPFYGEIFYKLVSWFLSFLFTFRPSTLRTSPRPCRTFRAPFAAGSGCRRPSRSRRTRCWWRFDPSAFRLKSFRPNFHPWFMV
jgi:hypothetical protein